MHEIVAIVLRYIYLSTSMLMIMIMISGRGSSKSLGGLKFVVLITYIVNYIASFVY